MQQALDMIKDLLTALLKIPGFAGSVILEFHIIADRGDVKVVPKVYK